MLVWREDRGPRARAGQIAGHLRKDDSAHVITINARKTTRARLVWAWHHGRWPKACLWHKNRQATDDRIENLHEISDLEFHMAVGMRAERLLPPGVVPVPCGFQAIAHHCYAGTYKAADEAHEAYKAAHIERYGSASPWATGGSQMSFLNENYSAPTESFLAPNGSQPGIPQGQKS
ncbi:HNH endonuclease [Candidatus Accumulibacter sp. ACC007]|uniref:HNH endonuclease n=1 Tax=Candidatus Accumulibacter sp. ACC007 TaxID=2823333 RepID=UPI00342BAD7B